jgi:hypothetical protein
VIDQSVTVQADDGVLDLLDWDGRVLINPNKRKNFNLAKNIHFTSPIQNCLEERCLHHDQQIGDDGDDDESIDDNLITDDLLGVDALRDKRLWISSLYKNNKEKSFRRLTNRAVFALIMCKENYLRSFS